MALRATGATQRAQYGGFPLTAASQYGSGHPELSLGSPPGTTGTVLRLPGGRDVTLGLHGRHQAGNALLALRVVEALALRDRWQLDGDALQDGLRRLRLPGRFERREWRGRPVVLDGARNPIKLAVQTVSVGPGAQTGQGCPGDPRRDRPVCLP